MVGPLFFDRSLSVFRISLCCGFRLVGAQSISPTLRSGPAGQSRPTGRPLALVEIDPYAVEVIKVAPQAEAGAGPVHCIGLGAGAGIFVDSPFIPGCVM